MKKHLFFAILVMAVAAFASVAVVSCKKETQDALNNKSIASFARIDPNQIGDIDAYLKDFKQRMQESKGDETLSLGDAAWFLSSLANRDFGHVCKYTGFRFDTIYGQVNVTNGEVSLADLNMAYNQISTDIDKFYHSLSLDNKHFRFIDAVISEDGRVTVPMFITYNESSKDIYDTLYYFPDIFYADSVGTVYFDEDAYYSWDDSTTSTGAIYALEYALNSLLSISSISSGRLPYYISSRIERPFFGDYPDPQAPPVFSNSRIFCSGGPNGILDYDQMLYALDSYLGLGVSLNTNPTTESIIVWNINAKSGIFSGSPLTAWYHRPEIHYGISVLGPDPSVQ